MKQEQRQRLRGRRWMEIRRAVLSDSPLCIKCFAQGRVTAAVEVDHIVPISRGGSDELENLQALCIECHRAKTRADIGAREARTIGIDGYPIEA